MFDINNIINAAIAEAVNARITELLQQHANLVGALAERIETLEKNEEALVRRIAALENNPAQGVDTQAAPVTGLTRDEVEALIEAKMDLHLECYDHDSYDEATSKVDDYDFDEFVKTDDFDSRLREELEDVLNNCSLSVRF